MIGMIKFAEYLNLRYDNVGTKRQYLRIAENFSKLYDDVTQESINSFLGRYRNITTNRGAAKALIDFANKTKEIDIPKKKSRKGAKIYKFLEKEEIDRIINYTSYKTSMLVQLYFETGLRLSELLNVKSSDIDLKKNMISGIGKGNKPFCEQFSVNSHEKVRDYLNSIPFGTVYPFHYQEVTYQPQKFWYVLREECERIGIQHMHPHRIRHSLGHYLRARKGFDLEQVREKLRHASINTTQIYAVATKEEVAAKMRDEVFQEAPRLNDNLYEQEQQIRNEELRKLSEIQEKEKKEQVKRNETLANRLSLFGKPISLGTYAVLKAKKDIEKSTNQPVFGGRPSENGENTEKP